MITTGALVLGFTMIIIIVAIIGFLLGFIMGILHTARRIPMEIPSPIEERRMQRDIDQWPEEMSYKDYE